MPLRQSVALPPVPADARPSLPSRSGISRYRRSRRALAALGTAAVSLAGAVAVVAVMAAPAPAGAAPAKQVSAYWVVASDGGIFSFGGAGFYGSTGGMRINKPVVGMAGTSDSLGYWEVAADGGIFAYGDAGFYGSTGNVSLNKPVVGMAATPDGRGYWLVASDGGIFAYGDAGFYGSTGNIMLNKPVGVLSTNRDPSGRPRVVDLVPKARERLFPVGRLDLYSAGLILLTNDGELANRLTHPRYGVRKQYRAIVAGQPTPEVLAQLKRGLDHFRRLGLAYRHQPHLVFAPARLLARACDPLFHRFQILL